MHLSDTEIKSIKGLSDGEVKEKLKQYGYNELPHAEKRGILRIVLGVLQEPMFLLLVACGAIYLILGDVQEALMLLGFVFVIMGITIYQESKTEKALDALKDLSSPRALVIRNGEQTRIPGREVVCGDIMIIREGDRVPADSILLWSMNLGVDESLLTGESLPVRKISCKNPEAVMSGDQGIDSRPGGDDLPYLFSGSLVVQGQGIARVSAVGVNTEMGKIGKALVSIKDEPTLLQRETGKIVKMIFIFAVMLCAVIIGVYGLTRADWLGGVLSGITLAMALLPEEFPVVLTIFLALGAWRISKKHVLTRRIAAVETLGTTTVLCVDKTGTLTQNRMTIKSLYTNGAFFEVHEKKEQLPENFHKLVEYGILASKQDPFDPMEKALNALGHRTLHNTEHLHNDWDFIQEYPLSPEILALSHVWESAHADEFIIAAKGAPEAIFDLCHLPEQEQKVTGEKAARMAADGLRVLGVAGALSAEKVLPGTQHDFDFRFIGLIGLADPVRETVPPAIAECYRAGIRVVMITGDYSGTACNIARQIGLQNPGQVITGPELEKMSAEELKEKIRTVNIFARVVPEQKLLIVNALKAAGEVVGMTGDGVNDAPALKSAHIGVAMGERGTDVARESAGIVLLKDDFTCIVEAVKTGRRIFDNLKKAMAYIISVHIPIAGIALLPVLMGWPLVLFPVHIVFLELLIDPACSIVFEAEAAEPDVMLRRPRAPGSPLFGKRMLFISFLQGLFSLAAVVFVFRIAGLILGNSTTAAGDARTLAFITLLVSNLCLILCNRSWKKSLVAMLKVKNRALPWVVLGAAGFLLLVIYVPWLQKLFHFGYMHLFDLFFALSAGIAAVVWFELIKWIARKKGIDLLKG